MQAKQLANLFLCIWVIDTSRDWENRIKKTLAVPNLASLNFSYGYCIPRLYCDSRYQIGKEGYAEHASSQFFFCNTTDVIRPDTTDRCNPAAHCGTEDFKRAQELTPT